MQRGLPAPVGYGAGVNGDDDLAARLRAICMALPEVTERASHGVPTWFVRNKKSFAQLWADGHHDDDFPHLWCAGLPGAQEALIGAAPMTFLPPALRRAPGLDRRAP